MNKENASKLWTLIKEAGDYLVGQLPDHPNHPKGRNSYAHVAICVKDHFNASYKDIPDEKLDGKSVRLVAAWNTQEEDVDGLLETLKNSN